MEAEETPSEEPPNATPYYCNICKIYCASLINLQTHFLGYRHKAVEEALKSHGIVKSLSDTGESIRPPETLPDYIHTEPERHFGKTLEEQLNSCRDTEPAIGLQYVTEYQSKESLLYECNLCGCQTGLTNMFMHVLGVKHRLAYLKKHHPKVADVKGRGSHLSRKLKEIAAKVEQEEGRKHIMVSMDIPVLKEDKYSLQLSDSLVTWFCEDDDAPKLKDSAKNSKEDNRKEEDTNKPTKGQCDDGSNSEDVEQQDKNTVQLENVTLSDSDSEEFSNNEELLNYLQTFEIVDEEDASFILKVTQKLTNALVVYREKVSERKNSFESNPEENVDPSEQSRMTSGRRDEPDIGFSEKQSPAQYSYEDMGTVLNVNPPNKRKASLLCVNDKAMHCKRGTFVSTFVEVPNEHASPDEMQDTPSSQECLPNFESDKNSSFPNLSEASTGSLPGPSVSESRIIANFFSSIKNMEADEVAATLHKIASSNPSFSGMDVENVIKILTENGILISKKTTSTN
ncbi:uncharacterized protein LOC121933114 [Sceloporus undulatus]|uniref:uncharacterized protein LOC121933114 n=1 Tax=Sceloporus undulatus TaxID=8520 RepID=UPI001C4A8331|nr:uncharacterized protein LOC121933114 [Sceloporus undulatus]